jgi:hypothetical protein
MGDLDDVLQRFRQQTQAPDAVEIQRLRLLVEGANKQLQKVNADTEQSQINAAEGRVDFYDKLTLGSGATIAALVSFLGAHTTKLQPTWILRGALISLVLTMIASLFRNYRYPNYVLQIHKISFIRCTRREQQCRLDCLKADPTAIDIKTGQPINLPEFAQDIERADKELETIQEESERLGERLRKQWTYAQFLAISFATLAMCFLVWLAIANF